MTSVVPSFNPSSPLYPQVAVRVAGQAPLNDTVVTADIAAGRPGKMLVSVPVTVPTPRFNVSRALLIDRSLSVPFGGLAHSDAHIHGRRLRGGNIRRRGCGETSAPIISRFGILKRTMASPEI